MAFVRGKNDRRDIINIKVNQVKVDGNRKRRRVQRR